MKHVDFMSKQDIAESLESINKKLNMIVKKQCSRSANASEPSVASKSDSDKDGAEEVEEEGKSQTHPLSILILLYGKSRKNVEEESAFGFC